jgi:hypothetical protein
MLGELVRRRKVRDEGGGGEEHGHESGEKAGHEIGSGRAVWLYPYLGELDSHRISELDRKLANQQTGIMKVTIDLPEPLVKQVKLRAIREGRKM